MREIHFFDLDGTLVDVKNFVWVIDKECPSKPLLKIGPLEFSLIKNNFYKKDNLLIDYNGDKFFISKEIYDKVNKRKKLPVDRLGLSFREFKDKEYIDKFDFDFLYKNIKHLAGRKDVKIAFLTARPNRYKHGDFSNKLRELLKNLGLSLYKIYFLGDKTEVHHKEYLSYRKSIILLEHLIGLKIEGNKFKAFKQDKFNKVYFYDDSVLNIDSANSIQEIFNEIYSNTDDKLKDRIIKVINSKPQLINNLITSNKINKFDTNIFILNSPIKYPIVVDSYKYIKTFKQFGL